MYADNIVLHVSQDDPREAIGLIQDDIDSLHNWCLNNSLTVNSEKSMIMKFRSKHRLNNCPNPIIKMGNVELPVTTTYSYLDILLDGPLTISPYCNRLRKSMGHKIFKISKLRK